MTTKSGARPADLSSQAVWPPKASLSGPVTTSDTAVVRAGAVPEGGYGVRIGKVPASSVPRTDGTSAMPTEGPGVARRAIPAPASAGTTSTIPPPHVRGEPLREVEDVEPAPTPTTTPTATAGAKKKGSARR